MRHSAINRGVMRDWLQYCAERGAPWPTLAEIVERFRFWQEPLLARTLLADLADAGQITLRWEAGRTEPHIALGRIAKSALGPARPERAVRKPAAPTAPAATAAPAKPRMSRDVVRAFRASGMDLGPWLTAMVEAGVRATGGRAAA